MLGLGLKRRLFGTSAPPSRRDQILKYVDKSMRGVEIGPYHAPLAPKREGYGCLALDVFCTEEVRRRAEADPFLTAEQAEQIEDVDLVGAATDLDRLVEAGSLNYVVSSHNFEHLPDPIRFLQACESVLRPGGYLSMAIPDQRCCFDYFRWPTTLTEWLEAYFAGRDRPTAPQMFAQDYARTRMEVGGGETDIFPLSVSVSQARPYRTLRPLYEDWLRKTVTPPAEYQDCHCWAFTPASFEQLILELRFLNLVHLTCVEVARPGTTEFHVHLRKSAPAELSEEAFYPEREALMRRAAQEVADKV